MIRSTGQSPVSDESNVAGRTDIVNHHGRTNVISIRGKPNGSLLAISAAADVVIVFEPVRVNGITDAALVARGQHISQ